MPGSVRVVDSISAWHDGHIMCVEVRPMGTTVVNMFVPTVAGAATGVYGPTGFTPPTASKYDGGADGGGTYVNGGAFPVDLLIFLDSLINARAYRGCEW